MKRVSKFRGKRIDNGEWVYGCLCDYFRGSGKCIMPDSFFATRDFGETDEEGIPKLEDGLAIGEWFPVIPESVGEFSGLLDRHGKEIYDCEVIFNDDRKENGIVKFDEEKSMFVVEYIESKDSFPLWESISNLYYSIGNVFSNPELVNL